jgi:molybdenum cofactor biosynthesis enzyme MoaA
MNILYRLYHGIPAKVRLPLVRHVERIALRIRLFDLLWSKLIMRYHLLYGARRGVTLELTDKCNLKCLYCPKSLDIGVKGAHMDWELLVKAIDGAMCETRVEIFNLVGFGEPFLYPKLEEAIRYIKQVNPTAEVRLTSNGTLLSADVGRRMAEVGLTQITISVNATSDVQYQRINASNSYEKVVENTKSFLRAINDSGRDILVIVQVLSGVNDEAQIQKFRDFWAPHLGRCGVIQVQPFVNWAGQIDTQNLLDRELSARGTDSAADREQPRNMSTVILLRELKDRKKDVDSPFAHDSACQEKEVEPYPCFHLHRTRIVSREGNALACCMVYPDDQGDLALGNIRDHAFHELYLSGKVVELRRKDLNGKLGKYSPCNRCNAWKTVPNIWWRNPLHRWIGPKWW